MRTFDSLLKNDKLEFWGKWIARVFSLILLPTMYLIGAHLETTLVAHGQRYFAPKDEFNRVVEKINNHSHSKHEIESAVLKTELSAIMITLTEIKADVRELRKGAK